MRSTENGLVTVAVSLLVWGTAQAGPLDGATVTWSHSESGTGSTSHYAGVNGNSASLQAFAAAYPTQNGSGGTASGTLTLDFQIVTPTEYSLSWGGNAPPSLGGPSGVLIIFAGHMWDSGGMGDMTGILQPGSYQAGISVFASCQYSTGGPHAGGVLDFTFVPEPLTLGLFVLGAAGLARRRRGKSSRKNAS
jgi:hypothetical protein